MPTPYIEEEAKKHDQTISIVEAKWEKAKEQAAKEGRSKDWAYIVGIFKHMEGE